MSTKTVKVSELIGPALDWAVAKCEGGDIRTEHGVFLNTGDGYEYFTPSVEWAQGGPIIEREDIQWCKLNGQIEAWSGFDYIDWRVDWESDARMPEGSGFGAGPTTLIAAMRCYVASRLGDTVEIPSELIP